MKVLIIIFVLVVVFFFVFTKFGGEKDESDYSGPVEKASFAGGCFWCMEAAFEGVEGVVEVVSGYEGGKKENPTYEEVSAGITGHLETVEVFYNPNVVSYEELVDFYWRQVDPVDEEGQFVDKGTQYGTAIFYHNESQRKIAEESKKALDESGRFDKPIVTQVLPASKFYRAEEYHQDYYKKRVLQYKMYEKGSGRKNRLGKIWGTK